MGLPDRFLSEIRLTDRAIFIIEDNFTITMEYDVRNNLIYLGRAAIGSTKSSAVWQIRKFLYDASDNATDILWASGDKNFDKVWNDRLTYTYS